MFNHTITAVKITLSMILFMNTDKMLILDIDGTIQDHGDDIDPSKIKNGKIPFYD